VLARIVIIAAVLLFLAMWVRAVIDVFRRPDLTVPVKLAWTVGMLVLPLIGLLIYMMLRPTDAQIAQRAPR
jgi:hypothetical protein